MIDVNTSSWPWPQIDSQIITTAGASSALEFKQFPKSPSPHGVDPLPLGDSQADWV
jgi:hypothetical protein